MLAILRENLIIPAPGPLRARLLAMATYRRRGRLPQGEKRLVRFYVNQRNYVAIPRGLLAGVHRLTPVQVVDRRLVLPPVDFGWRGALRPEQAEAARRIAAMGGGMLVATTGAGKTEMAMALIAAFRQPALWLCNTKTLAHQALARARKLFNLPPRAYGFIAEGEFGVGTHLTVATLQSLSGGRHRGVERRFGAVVVDEADICPALTYSQVVSRFPARYRLGITATPERNDGLGPLALAILGPGMVRVEERVLVQNKRIVVPTVRIVPTAFRYWGSGDWADLQRTRAADGGRNALVCALAAREFRAGHRVVILTELKPHAAILVGMLRRIHAVPALAVTGPVGAAARKKAFRAAESGQAVMVATKLADRGLDLPALDRLVLAAPGRSLPRLQHQVGRVIRAAEGKTGAVVYDLVDVHVPALLGQARIRAAWYRQREYRVEQIKI